jgi:hypothetical protein
MAPVLAPLLVVLSRAGIDQAVIPPSIRAPGTVLFAVISAGDYAGRTYTTGEVLVCRGADSGEPVVLTPRGPGRPMLGRVDHDKVTRSTRLVGDAGEPCAPERWSAAGTVERVLLAAPAVAQACERFGRASATRTVRHDRSVVRAPAPTVQRTAPAGADQLPLFVKAA